MQVFALLVRASAFVEADAKGFVAVRLDKVERRVVRRRGCARGFAFKWRCVAFACLAFIASLAFASKRRVGVAGRAQGRWRGPGSQLQEVADV